MELTLALQGRPSAPYSLVGAGKLLCSVRLPLVLVETRWVVSLLLFLDDEMLLQIHLWAQWVQEDFPKPQKLALDLALLTEQIQMLFGTLLCQAHPSMVQELGSVPGPARPPKEL